MEKKKKKITLLAVQLGSVIGDVKQNVVKARTLLEDCLSKRRADIVFLPEVWTCGWDCDSFPCCAENINDSLSINMLKELAMTYCVNIVGGSFIEQKPNGELANTLPVINRNGELVCTYEKNHLYSYYGANESSYIKAGKNPVMINLDGVNVGLSICYDIRFPELYRAYRKAGADLIVNLAAWGANKRIPWDTMTMSRAIENQTYMVALTQTGVLKDGSKNLGHSMFIDYNGEVLNEIFEKEAGFYAEIDLDEMYKFREKCTILNDVKDSYEVILK